MLNPSDPSKPVPQLPGELSYLDHWRDGNKQGKDLNNISLRIIQCAGSYLAETKREPVVRCTESAELYDRDPVSHWERDDGHELNKWVIVSDGSPRTTRQRQRLTT